MLDLSKAQIITSSIADTVMPGDRLVVLEGALIAVISKGIAETIKHQEQITSVAVEASVDPRWPDGPLLTNHINLPTKEAILNILVARGPMRAYHIGNALEIPAWAADIRGDLSGKIKQLLAEGKIRKVKDSGRLAKYEVVK